MKSNLLLSFLRYSVVLGALLAPAVVPMPVHAGPVLPEVGPDTHFGKVTCGYLKVYSRTEQTQWGENTYYYPHSAYWIYSSGGKRLKTVANHDTSIDESPSKVSLAPGHYVVRAWSDDQGLVTVPVVIKVAETTTVNLEEGHGQASDARVLVGNPS